MIDLKQFRENAIAHDLCEEYTAMWSEAKSKKQLFEMACDANGVEFMASSLAEGWGLSTEYLSDKFKNFVNGKYICEYKNNKGRGYDSAMLCEYSGATFEVTTTLLLVLNSNVPLRIKPYHICKIYVAGISYVNIELGEGSSCYIYAYGGDPLITGDLDEERVHLIRYMDKEV